MSFQSPLAWKSVPPILPDPPSHHSSSSAYYDDAERNSGRRRQKTGSSAGVGIKFYGHYEGNYVLDNLMPNLDYTVKIRAKNKFGWTDEETTFQFRTSLNGEFKFVVQKIKDKSGFQFV